MNAVVNFEQKSANYAPVEKVIEQIIDFVKFYRLVKILSVKL